MNLSNYMDNVIPPTETIVLTCYLRLDKETILQILGYGSIWICGETYKVPENKLIELLMNKDYLKGSIKFQLERL